MEEVWKDIQGYEGLYQVSNLGRVKSLDRIIDERHHVKEKILKPAKNTGGYYSVSLSKNNKVKRCTIHRLVATEFIMNIQNLPEINHKDENILNNNVKNLEWCTGNYNYNYGTRIQRCINTRTKKVIQCDKNGNFIKEYSGAKEAAIENGFISTVIRRCCSGKIKTAYGYIWKYKEAE